MFALSANAGEKKTTFNKELFDKAQSDGKIVVISSWVKYCSSCASQMKVLQKAKNKGELSDIKFDNIEYFSFEVTNREIADLLNVKYQTTLLIFKGFFKLRLFIKSIYSLTLLTCNLGFDLFSFPIVLTV